MSRATLSVLVLTLDVAAIAGNAVVILAFIANRKLRKPSGCYVTNLATADLCMSLICIPFYVTTVIQDDWPLGDYFCAVWTGMERVCSLVSNFAIVAICFDRYWLVTRSSHYLGKHTVSSARWRIAGIWLAAILFRVPFVVFGMVETWGKLQPMSVCDPHSIYDVPFQVGIYEYDTIYTLIATLGEFVIPLMLIIIWGVQVYIYLENREKQKFIKAVERSRAMSLDFTFPQRELANFANEERRGSNQSRISFWSKYLSPDSKKSDGNGNGLSRSRDTIAGPMSDPEEDPQEGRCSPCRSNLLNGSPAGWKPVDKSKVISNSEVDIVLDPASGGETDGSTLWDEVGLTTKERFTKASKNNKCLRVLQRNKSNLNRKSVSLNTLEVPGDKNQPLNKNPKGFPTSKSTPSIILTRLCDHNVLSPPAVVKKGGDISLQVSFSLEIDEDVPHQGQCEECQKEDDLSEEASSADSQSKTDNRVTANNRASNGKDRISLSTNAAAASPARRRVLREGSTTSTCDFLDVPSTRTHCRPQPLNMQETDMLSPQTDYERRGSESASVAAAEEQEAETRNSSFSSCASDLPDSVSSIITVSEPPSPGLRRASQMDIEEVQRVLNSRAKQRYRIYRRRALITILVMVCVFVVFQLPYVIVSCVYSFCRGDCVPDMVYEAANWWYWAKVLLNPYLYAYISPEFRRYSRGILKCNFGGKRRR